MTCPRCGAARVDCAEAVTRDYGGARWELLVCSSCGHSHWTETKNETDNNQEPASAGGD